MMTVTEKVAYLKGLADGLDIDATTKEGKLLTAIMDVLGDLANDLEGLSEYVDELSEQLDAVDEDLDTLEGDFYGDEDEDYDDDEDEEFYDITCPKCGEEFCVDEETLLDGSVDCPECGEVLEFEIECDDDCDCCECDCDEKED